MLKIEEEIRFLESIRGLRLSNHPNCPKCGSFNVEQKTDWGACLCTRGDCWSHPECLDCGFSGYMNSDGDGWLNHDRLDYLKKEVAKCVPS